MYLGNVSSCPWWESLWTMFFWCSLVRIAQWFWLWINIRHTGIDGENTAAFFGRKWWQDPQIRSRFVPSAQHLGLVKIMELWIEEKVDLRWFFLAMGVGCHQDRSISTCFLCKLYCCLPLSYRSRWVELFSLAMLCCLYPPFLNQ